VEVVPVAQSKVIDQGMRETARRLLGRATNAPCLAPIAAPMEQDEKAAWVTLAKVIDRRLQSSVEQCGGRTPDMGKEAAAALRAVLQDVCGTRFVSQPAPFLYTGGRMLRLSYQSKLSTTMPAVAEKQIRAILDAANRNNAPMAIGGCLYYNTNTFEIYQILEGPVKNVRHLFKTISADPRHVGCEILHMEETGGTRKFETFGMSKGTEQISREEFLSMVQNAETVASGFAERAEWVSSKRVMEEGLVGAMEWGSAV